MRYLRLTIHDQNRFTNAYLTSGVRECYQTSHINRELEQRRRQRQRKRHLKYNFISFVLLRDYFNSFNFYRNGELPRNQIGRSDVQAKKENENSVSSMLSKMADETVDCFVLVDVKTAKDRER